VKDAIAPLTALFASEHRRLTPSPRAEPLQPRLQFGNFDEQIQCQRNAGWIDFQIAGERQDSLTGGTRPAGSPTTLARTAFSPSCPRRTAHGCFPIWN